MIHSFLSRRTLINQIIKLSLICRISHKSTKTFSLFQHFSCFNLTNWNNHDANFERKRVILISSYRHYWVNLLASISHTIESNTDNDWSTCFTISKSHKRAWFSLSSQFSSLFSEHQRRRFNSSTQLWCSDITSEYLCRDCASHFVSSNLITCKSFKIHCKFLRQSNRLALW